MNVSMVPKDAVARVWPRVEGYLSEACVYTYGRYTVGDVLYAILDYDYTLWIAFDHDGEIKGAVVTTFVQYPRKKCLVLSFCGGVDLPSWKSSMLSLLQKFAFDTGCDSIESTGRDGWARVFKDDGHQALWHTYELPVATAGLGEHHG